MTRLRRRSGFEMSDRFGKIPEPAEFLIKVARVRVCAQARRFLGVGIKRDVRVRNISVGRFRFYRFYSARRREKQRAQRKREKKKQCENSLHTRHYKG